MTYFITLIVAYCSIVYEILIAQTLSALMGNTIMRYSITIGLYLASMGIGAMLCQNGNERDSARQRFIFLQLKDRAVRTRFRDYGIRLHVLNETRFKLASKVEFDDTFKPGRINSVFRPTMPALDFFNVNFPY